MKLFYVLIVIVIALGTITMAKARGWLIPQEPELTIVDNTIDINDLTLRQKIAQMTIVPGSRHNMKAWKGMQLGGIHLFAMQSERVFRKIIADHQEGMVIPFMVTADLEGCLNPFAYFRNSTAVSKIDTVGKAFQKGSDEGKYLRKLGFTLNFAPVVDIEDQIWNCRSFPGNEKNISELAEAYLLGLQSQKVAGTIKHYPGKTLVVKDPHKYLVAAEISAKDVYPYRYFAKKGNAKAAMVSHLIVSGEINSSGKPAVVSEKVVKKLKAGFSGLIISDEINMLGLKNYYKTLDEMYVAVFKAGNDIVLNFNEDPNEIHRMIKVVEKAVKAGKIKEKEIDASVRKILQLKGFKVKD